MGGPDGESAAAMRYLSQRYSMKNARVAGVLTDIGTEELGPSSYQTKYFLQIFRITPIIKSLG